MELTKYKLGDIADISVGFPFESERFNEDGDGVRLVRGMNVSERMLRFGDESRWWSDITENLEPYFLKEKALLAIMVVDIQREYRFYSEKEEIRLQKIRPTQNRPAAASDLRG